MGFKFPPKYDSPRDKEKKRKRKNLLYIEQRSSQSPGS